MNKYTFIVKINGAEKGEVITIDLNGNKARKEAIKIVKDAFDADKDDIYLTLSSIEQLQGV